MSAASPRFGRGAGRGLRAGPRPSLLWPLPGVLLFVILSGSAPFSADDEEELLNQVRTASYSFDGAVWRAVSPAAKDVISKLLVVDPMKRLAMEDLLAHPFVRPHVTALIGANPSLGVGSATRPFVEAGPSSMTGEQLTPPPPPVDMDKAKHVAVAGGPPATLTAAAGNPPRLADMEAAVHAIADRWNVNETAVEELVALLRGAAVVQLAGPAGAP